MFDYLMNQGILSPGNLASKMPLHIEKVKKFHVRESLYAFQNTEHTLEHVAMVNGVEYINDSRSTNVNATWWALEQMYKPVMLIMGGVDKGNDYSVIERLILHKVKSIINIGRNHIKINKNYLKHIKVHNCMSMPKAVQIAYNHSKRGYAVLLSPACSSIDLFKDYKHRGREFKKYVKAL